MSTRQAYLKSVKPNLTKNWKESQLMQKSGKRKKEPLFMRRLVLVFFFLAILPWKLYDLISHNYIGGIAGNQVWR